MLHSPGHRRDHLSPSHVPDGKDNQCDKDGDGDQGVDHDDEGDLATPG